MGTSARRPRRASRPRAAILRLDADVYSSAVVDRARQAFAHLASIEVRREGRRQTIRFSRMDPEAADRLVDEFANYALSCLLVSG